MSLVLDAFDEKNINALTLKKYNDTAVFVNYVTKWHILEIRPPTHGTVISDEDRMKFESGEDERSKLLCEMGISFKLMDIASSSARAK